MGRMVDGTWYSDDSELTPRDRFERKPTTFREQLAPGSRFEPRSGRYHVYVSLACPWAHRTLIGRTLRGLDDHISVTVVDWFMGEDGWSFEQHGSEPDPEFGASHLHQVYAHADPHFTGRVTVPVLWDTETKTIVNNESREILRMLSRGFAGLGNDRNLAPEDLEAEIDAMITANYESVNNGVYKAGFAGNQQAHEEAATTLFARLDALEAHLASRRFLVGDQLTEADICLFTTLVRCDPVYHTHFKCTLRRIVDYPNLWGFTRDVYKQPGIAATVDMLHIKNHYYQSHPWLNPRRIVPLGPDAPLDAPHDRARLAARAQLS